MVTGEILLKEVLDFTVQPSVTKWKWVSKCHPALKQQPRRQRQTIFDVVPRRHQFSFQFVHLVGLSGHLPPCTCGLGQPGAEAALVLQRLLPPVLCQLILHPACHVLRRSWRNRVHASLKLESAAHCCDRGLNGGTKVC